MTSTRVQAMALVTAAVAGYAGAAAITALAAPALPPIAIATDFGPGDGLTRYALTAAPGALGDDLLAALEAVPGVATAQSLGDGRALVATDGVTPERLGAVPGSPRSSSRRQYRSSAPSATRTSRSTAGTSRTPAPTPTSSP
ncbi:hypothetical protein [Blastococcus brunescens]|uniref:Uncharacterized protein n=1 Tax=Blastococcus brunescens TaxID=1564165 RepID=A0ABZ1B0D5_9ACTN|nr:hypothetical protein [Blastococcus sp. BMG 8361]WRL63363.1 hypothetical protein U6N30_27045 [Blastococcus sp. BMG 8361]